MSLFRRKLTVDNVITILLLVILAAISFFLWTYLRKTDPVDIVKATLPVTPDDPPKYLYTIAQSNVSEPYDVAVSSNGNLYVTDPGNKSVHVFDINGKYLFKFGSAGKGKGQFLAPVGIAVSKTKVYVADALTMKVQVFDLSGKYLHDLMTQEIKNSVGAVRPAGLYVDENDNLYLTDIFNHRVLKFNSEGQVILTFGRPGNKKGNLLYPNDIAVDQEGYIFVSDSNNSRVQVFDPSGRPDKIYGGSSKDLNVNFAITKGITVDKKGFLYIAEPAMGKIFVIKADKNKPEPLFIIDSSGKDEPLNMPTGICSYYNKIFVTDPGNHRIIVYGY